MAKYCPVKDGPALYPECLECGERLCEKDCFAVLIAGSRTFDDYGEFSSVCDRLLGRQKDPVIVSGGAAGTDTLAKRYAAEHGYLMKEFPADWKAHGKSAGYLRNRRMHEYIAHFPRRGVILFWDGKSRGTAQSFELAERFRNPLRVYDFIRKEFRKR